MDNPKPKIHDCGPNDFCVFCPCLECRKFFSYKKPPPPKKEENTRVFKYSDTAFVNTMRAKFAKRQEEREEKLKAEREKPEKPEKKDSEKTIKKRRKGPRFMTCAKNRRIH